MIRPSIPALAGIFPVSCHQHDVYDVDVAIVIEAARLVNPQ